MSWAVSFQAEDDGMTSAEPPAGIAHLDLARRRAGQLRNVLE